MVGDNSKDYERSSGAYIFRPDGAPLPLCDNQIKPRRVSGQRFFKLNRFVLVSQRY